jgi:hypothetical protein
MNTFGVVRLADQWAITVNGALKGRYRFQVDAEEAALRLAARVRVEGEPVEVLVQGPWGEMTPLKVA